MWKSRVMTSAAVLACGGLLACGLTGFASPDAAEVEAADAVAAIQAVAPTSFSRLATTSSSQDAVAEAALPEGATVSVPADAADGISLGDGVQIGLPFAQRAEEAAASPLSGVVAYDNNNGSATVPLIRDDGAVQITTVIENAHAPKRYDYPMDIPDGGSLVQTPEGVVAIVTGDGAPLRVLGDAWAKDANGNSVPTHYEVRGNTLTQVVDFTEHTAFPVVADPTTTGVYSYSCVLQNGSSYFIKPGTALSTCKGSRLQKYINGRLVQTIPLTGYGYPANPKAFGTVECYIALSAGLALSVYGIPGVLSRFTSGAIAFVASAGLPSITACRG
jgi:hypothetical protein